MRKNEPTGISQSTGMLDIFFPLYFEVHCFYEGSQLVSAQVVSAQFFANLKLTSTYVNWQAYLSALLNIEYKNEKTTSDNKLTLYSNFVIRIFVQCLHVRMKCFPSPMKVCNGFRHQQFIITAYVDVFGNLNNINFSQTNPVNKNKPFLTYVN